MYICFSWLKNRHFKFHFILDTHGFRFLMKVMPCVPCHISCYYGSGPWALATAPNNHYEQVSFARRCSKKYLRPMLFIYFITFTMLMLYSHYRFYTVFGLLKTIICAILEQILFSLFMIEIGSWQNIIKRCKNNFTWLSLDEWKAIEKA